MRLKKIQVMQLEATYSRFVITAVFIYHAYSDITKIEDRREERNYEKQASEERA